MKDMRILAVYDDPYWENQTIETIRFTSRVFLRRDHQYAFLKIVGEDGFGKRNHYETLGGGVEDNETFVETAIREVAEEMGAVASNYQCIGAIIDRLNPIQRLTYSVFFVADFESYLEESNRTEEEKILIESIDWLSPKEVIESLKSGENPIDAFVHRRDLTAFLALLEDMNNRT